MNPTTATQPREVATSVIVVTTLFAFCGVALLTVHVTLANPMLPKVIRDLPRLIGIGVLAWFFLRRASWARWAVFAVSLAAASVLLHGFFRPYQPPAPGMPLVPFLYYISRPGIALGYMVVIAMLFLSRPVVAHFRQSPANTNDRNAS